MLKKDARINTTPHEQSAAFQIAIEMLVRPHRFEIDQPDFVINGIAQQIELILATKLVHEQIGKITFLVFADAGVVRDELRRGIDIGSDLVVELLVGAGEAASLLKAVAHARRERGMKGVASSRGSAIDASKLGSDPVFMVSQPKTLLDLNQI